MTGNDAGPRVMTAFVLQPQQVGTGSSGGIDRITVAGEHSPMRFVRGRGD